MFAKLISRRATAWLAVASVFIFGFLTYRSLPREAAPDVKVPVVMVTTPYIGVSPEDVESLITVPLENELSSIKDLKKMTSTSAEGVSVIALEFEPEVVIPDALQRAGSGQPGQARSPGRRRGAHHSRGIVQRRTGADRDSGGTAR